MFGFGKGKIEIKINKFNFSPGETLEGTVTLKLKKPIRAKKLTISLIGERKDTQAYMSSGSRRSSSSTVRMFDFQQPLDGEKEYSIQPVEYSFKIKIPPGILSQQAMPKGAIGTAVKAMQLVSGKITSIKWYLLADLDIPKGFDVTKKVQINIA